MRDLYDPELWAYTVIRDGRRRGLRLHAQHLRLLAVLGRRACARLGPVDMETLALAIDSKTGKPDRLVPTRVAALRKALEPFGMEIVNGRHAGYSLRTFA